MSEEKTPVHQNALEPGTLIEQYEIERLLGHGAFGITYKALDTRLRRSVAIKEFLPQELAVRGPDMKILPKSEEDAETFKWGLKRFLEEAQTLARFYHKNIVQVLNFFEAFNTAYMVMMFIDGVTLGSRLKRLPEGKMTEEQIMEWLRPIMDGLEAVHNEGILHRDLKPGNIYVPKDSEAILIDFGAARQAIGGKSLSLSVVLTPGYAPYEQYSSKSGEQGPWSDIYALGAVVYRCMSGRKPDDAPDRINAFMEGQEDTMFSPKSTIGWNFTPGLVLATQAALSIRPKDRPQDISALRRILSAGSVKPSSRSPQPGQDTGEMTVIMQPQQIIPGFSSRDMTIGEPANGTLSSIPDQRSINIPPPSVTLKSAALGSLRQGTIVANSKPEGVDVYLDGIEKGKTPLRISNVVAGTRSVRFSLPGSAPVFRSVNVEPDAEVEVSVTIDTRKGKLKVNARTFFSDAKVKFYLDDKFAGHTPLVLDDVPVGTRKFKFAADRHNDLEGEVEIKPDAPLILTKTLQPLPGRVRLKSIPTGAEIWFKDKKSKLKTDVKANVPPGKYVITLKMDGYLDSVQAIEVMPDTDVDVSARLIQRQYAPTTIVRGVRTEVPRADFIEPFTKMEFVFVHNGMFSMGDIFEEGDEDERPAHEVKIDGFFMARYPVTQGQWAELMGANPSYFKSDVNLPVENVSWSDAQEFLKKMMAMHNGKYIFRLPTEAEWEFAARSGGKPSRYSGSNEIDAVAWYKDNSEDRSHPVGGKSPNGLWLFDMTGNVCEWVQDLYAYNAYEKLSKDNPVNNSDGFERVCRGGAWDSPARGSRCSFRYRKEPAYRLPTIGFRVVRNK